MACSASPQGGEGAAGTGGAAGMAGAPRRDGGAGQGGAAGPRDAGPPADAPPGLMRLRIAPEAPELRGDGVAPAEVDFEVIAIRSDGMEVPVGTAYWTLEDRRLGSIDPDTGRFRSSLDRGGASRVIVEAHGMTAMTTLISRVERTVRGAGVPADGPARFAAADTADPARAPRLVYPEPGVVMPRNVRAPVLMWEEGAAGDLYEVGLRGAFASTRFYVVHSGASFPYALPLAQADWRTLSESNTGGDLTVTLRRFDAAAGDVVAAPPATIKLADVDFRGAIYYWALNLGKIVRIRPDSAAPEDFLDPPANPDPMADPSHARCVACHTISRDGRRLAFEYWGGNQWAGIVDVTQPATPQLGPSVARGNFQTFNPEGTRIVLNFQQGLRLHDAATGAEIAGAGLPAERAAHPIWAPDGSALAYASNIMRDDASPASWEIDFGRGDLAVVPYLGFDRFGPPQVLVPGNGRANFYPTYDPTSRYVAYSRSDWSRSDNGPVQPSTGELWIVPATGGAPTELARANAGQRSWLPTFSPFEGGGYIWLAFFSRRDYGNAQAGTKGTGRRQLWVAAVDKDPLPGQDPSHPAFWLPAQDQTTENMSAYWAPEPCIVDGGAGCTSDVECCGGLCTVDASGAGMCGQAPPMCRQRGQACTRAEDCCDGMPCVDNFCGTIG